jgi:Zn ribbon nucleic-acid-binding protein
MEKTPRGTPVGIDDPYAVVERCDHLTDDGRCRYAVERGHEDPAFARERREDGLRCPAADPEGAWQWADCPHFRARQHARECVRCGLAERRIAHEDQRPLLEEHHLEYGDDSSHSPETSDELELSHEITVYLCRWCHAKIHDSWARIDDEVSPDPEALAAAEGRRSKEQSEFDFESAAERYEDDG